MGQERFSNEEIVAAYKTDVERLVLFLPWLEKKAGQRVAESYEGQDIAKNSMAFPVYDSTMLQFVREAKKTKFVNRNYVYVYSRLRMGSEQDEKRVIEHAGIQDMEVLGGILSKYIIQGTTRGTVWQEGMLNGVLLAVVKKMKELMDFWSRPDKGH